MKRIAALLVVPLALWSLAGCAASPGAEAPSVVGQWGGAAEYAPVLNFSDAGSFNGSDGCNTLSGEWTQERDVVTLENVATTLMACAGIDAWLSKASTVEVEGTSLRVFDAQGAEIGVLEHAETTD